MKNIALKLGLSFAMQAINALVLFLAYSNFHSIQGSSVNNFVLVALLLGVAKMNLMTAKFIRQSSVEIAI